MFIFGKLTERPHLLPSGQILQEESRGGLENNISLKSGHSLELRRDDRSVASIKWGSLRRGGGVKRPKLFELFNRSFRDEDFADIFSEVPFRPTIGMSHRR